MFCGHERESVYFSFHVTRGRERERDGSQFGNDDGVLSDSSQCSVGSVVTVVVGGGGGGAADDDEEVEERRRALTITTTAASGGSFSGGH